MTRLEKIIAEKEELKKYRKILISMLTSKEKTKIKKRGVKNENRQ